MLKVNSCSDKTTHMPAGPGHGLNVYYNKSWLRQTLRVGGAHGGQFHHAVRARLL